MSRYNKEGFILNDTKVVITDKSPLFKYYKNKRGIILYVITSGSLIIYTVDFNGEFISLFKEEVEVDFEYYRNKKINNILND